MPLRTLLMTAFVLQIVSIAGLIGGLSYRSSQNVVEDLAEQLMIETGDRITQELDMFLSRPHRVNQLNIAAYESGAIDTEDLNTLHRYLMLQHQQLGSSIEISPLWFVRL